MVSGINSTNDNSNLLQQDTSSIPTIAQNIASSPETNNNQTLVQQLDSLYLQKEQILDRYQKIKN